MPKIRGIKPETWTDETFVELSPLARLLFIGLWNYACDNGHLEDRSKQLKMRLLPADDCSVADLLRELEEHGRIVREEGWITVPTLREHQRIDKRWFATCEKPGCTDPHAKKADPEPETRSGHDVAPTSPPRDHDESTTGPRDELSGVDVDVDVDISTSPPASDRRSSTDVEREFDVFWAEYPRPVGKGQARKAYRAARKKASAEDLLDAILAQRPALTERGVQFCPHPSTWLNGERWLDQPAVVVPMRPGEADGVRYLDDGTVDESSLPPVDTSDWRRRRPGGAS